MGEIPEGTPKYTPFIIHEVTAEERERYRDSPTQSILKTPTAIFVSSEDDVNKTGRKLTFADSPDDREGSIDSSKSQTKLNVRNGGDDKTPLIEVAVSPVKSIRVSPDAWSAHLIYKKRYQDYPNETEKTDYTYSRLSVFHNREILPGLTMRPNMSRLPLRLTTHSAPTTPCTTPVTSRKLTAVSFSSPLVASLTQRFSRWHEEGYILRKRKSYRVKKEEKKNNSYWWWLLLLLLLVIGVWLIFGRGPILPTKRTALKDINIDEILLRLKAIEYGFEENRKKSLELQNLQLAAQLAKAKTVSLSWRCHRTAWRIMLDSQARYQQEIVTAKRNGLLAQRQIEDFKSLIEEMGNEMKGYWASQLKELRLEFSEQSMQEVTKKLHIIVAELLKRYDADKTGMADYALESAGGRILGIRCTQPWPGPRGISFDPSIVIRRGVAPGECWAFQGEGRLIIQLSHNINVSGCSIEHISSSIHPLGVAASAPKNFTLWGLKHEDDLSPHLFGSYVYDMGQNADTVQFFPIVHSSDTLFDLVELTISSNYGHPYTCLYRIRIHGSL